MAIYEEIVRVTTAGSAGSAVGDTTSGALMGRIISIYVNYHASAPATTDLDIDEVGGAAVKLVNLDDTATDATVYPAVALTNNAGVALTYDGTNEIYVPFAIANRPVKVTLAGCDALTNAVVVTILVER